MKAALAPSRWTTLLALALCVVIVAPLAIPVAVSFSDSVLVGFPPHGLTLRWYGKVLADADFRDTFLFSAELGAMVTLVCIALGLPCALGLARCEFPGKTLVNGLVLAPLIFPVLVAGVALLQCANALGITDSLWLLTLGHVAICLPYLVRSVSAALLVMPRTTEDAARTLGANPWVTFRRITLPQVAGGVSAGAVFCFVTSFDDYTMAMWLADARHFTLPLQVGVFIERSFDPGVAAIAGLMIGFSVLLIVFVERVLKVKLEKFVIG
ncbi:binding--dependent transport system inner membrane component family protein [Paraburkholderia xenovorans LB400]|uniref:ABC spermidine/putrescine transporter, inner membrane subunit n=1 Tax=Paraburkholderia xenovorans (strain LB400) TaxID=266265 RepID=Q13FP3_PARXL|nr:ABC transporter permease [Paraburkholderia xenovorans]ABE37096.1 ABC spermidine/putrescine transporter, inner membrane subunit [Paraburkholderia xenovorans LB400]AIP34619.1 binding--dependent transport system inner membrane component family protein [Paraburkholderia xenovorans LB400]